MDEVNEEGTGARYAKTFSKALAMQEWNSEKYHEVNRNIDKYVDCLFEPVVMDTNVGTLIEIKYGETSMRVRY